MRLLFRIALALSLLFAPVVASAQDDGAGYAARLDRAADALESVDGALDTRLERDARADLRTRAINCVRLSTG